MKFFAHRDQLYQMDKKPGLMVLNTGITFFIKLIKRLCIVNLKEFKKLKLYFVFLVFIKKPHYALLFEIQIFKY